MGKELLFTSGGLGQTLHSLRPLLQKEMLETLRLFPILHVPLTLHLATVKDGWKGRKKDETSICASFLRLISFQGPCASEGE